MVYNTIRMCAPKPFADAPEMGQLETVINSWQRPDLPDRLKRLARTTGSGSVIELAHLIRKSLSKRQGSHSKSQLEVGVIGWLYAFIRANVKRGRVFDLGEVLQQGSADCLGYAKLFTLLGRQFGLNVGVIEVTIDNGGRYVPHTAALVRLTNHQWRLVDLWYGSKNIRHKRVGVKVKRGREWGTEDLELRELSRLKEVCYLPDRYVDAITLYIRGNRYLARQEFDTAIEYYSNALHLYPGNARFLYNRAIAYENVGEYEKAGADYALALGDDAALTRILATEHDEVTSLLDLDAMGISDLAQAIYLLHRGFVTGKAVPLATIARKLGLSEKEAGHILSSVEARLAIRQVNQP